MNKKVNLTKNNPKELFERLGVSSQYDYYEKRYEESVKWAKMNFKDVNKGREVKPLKIK